MALDPTTNIGKLRLRVADYSDLPYFPDAVYQSVLDDNDDNLPRSAITMATYILGMLSGKVHRKLGLQLEVWGAEAFANYKQFLLLTVKDPAFMTMAPIPYGASGTTVDPLLQFMNDWNKNYTQGTESQQLAVSGAISPNDGSLYGPLGSLSTTTGQLDNGWQLP